MKIEKQVSNLEQSKNLKELGLNQEGDFFWMYGSSDVPFTEHKSVWYERLICRALTVGDMGEILQQIYYDVNKVDDKWLGWVKYNFTKKMEEMSYDRFQPEPSKTEAEARAAIILHLLEKNIITMEYINNKLS